MPNNKSCYCSTKHGVLYIVCICPASWLFCLNFVIILNLHPPKPLAIFLGLRHIQRLSGFSFKFNLVLKTVAALFSEINSVYRYKFSMFQYKIWNNIHFLDMLLFKCKKVPEPLCSYCNSADETPLHIFCTCNITKQLWNEL